MTEIPDIDALLPALPEIVLVVGAMVLLMVGAFRGERSATPIHWLAIVLLVASCTAILMLHVTRTAKTILRAIDLLRKE